LNKNNKYSQIEYRILTLTLTHYWVDMWTFKKIQKNHEVTCGSHCSWPLMI